MRQLLHPVIGENIFDDAVPYWNYLIGDSCFIKRHKIIPTLWAVLRERVLRYL